MLIIQFDKLKIRIGINILDQQLVRAMIQNSKQSIRAYLIDSIKKGTPEHEAFNKFKSEYNESFPTVIAIRINQKSQQIIDILALEQTVSYIQTDFKTISRQLKLIFDLINCLWYLSKKQYFSGLKPIQSFLFTDSISGNLKIKPYLAVPFKQFKYENGKKDKAIAKVAIQFCFEFPKSVQAYEIWKWAVFTSQLLFEFSLQNYIQKVLKTQKVEQFKPQIALKNRFMGDEQMLNMLTKCLSPDPTKRPSFQQIVLIFHKINIYYQTPVNQLYLNEVRKKYHDKQSSVKTEFEIQIKEDILLTDDFKKKLTAIFVRNGHKAPKSYKPIYRATRSQFNTRVFYEKCFEKSKLLFVIQSEDNGIICFYLQSTLTLNANSGFAGDFIADPSGKSFIYSTKNQESYKLQVKQKAFRAVQGKGPIIGDGDIILGGSPNQNWCNFPKSFQIGKHKTLTSKSPFSIKNYDVYIVTF